MKKMFKYLSLLLLLLPIFSMNGNRVNGAELESNDVNIILHKIAFPNGELPEEIANTGNLAGEHQDLLQEYRGLNGVTFEVYDMTEKFYEMRSSGSTVEAAQLALSQLADDDLGVALATQITATDVNGDKGVASFTLPATDDLGRDKVYLFHESQAPEVIETKAKNMVVVLPVYTEGEELLSTIHLFPKNEEKVHEEPPFEKIVVDQAGSYQFGDILTYEISTKVPVDIEKYQKFEVSDEADSGLAYQMGTLQVTIAGESAAHLYELVETESGFTVNFVDFEALNEHIGEEIVFQYQTQLVETKTETNAFKNHAWLVTDFEEITREVEVKTGGIHFIKVDLEDESILLSGAKFQVRNAKEEYLSKTATGYTWTTDAKDKNLVTLTSGDKGQFEINGLTYGDYYLQETVAPKGYELGTELVKFTVSENSYTAGDTGILKVVNLKTPERPVLPETSGEPEIPTRKVLPKTGETKNSSFIWLGAILIAGVAIALWQKNKKNGSERE
ncbi:SpaH/EbpB family LPXTG-anchored major pilin [Enterococcus asini]|uniref:SpaH/EbpB family LPXTG-anchored major pilin n=1 Tax=Enterococcus asini TaxID=57732 RepID=UPI000E52876A|nr:SpaH/EbpB family LPXTG-anchored major pilin [Enterococcus asini]RGW12490.1 isopeptide-forming domain-containing fimbrial protein [Enterococcus asini]